MSQGVLPFKYEEEKKESGITSLSGLPVYLDLATVMGIGESIKRHLHIKQRGWTDEQNIMSLIMLNIAGGNRVDDLQRLKSDAGFCRILRRIEQKGMKRRARRELEHLCREKHIQSLPSPSAVFRYLSAFHDPAQEKDRIAGKAFIPVPNEHLRGLMRVNGDMISFIQDRDSEKIATLDQDATLVETTKRDALYCYKTFKAYQPLNTWWSEQGLILHTEFRDGNVPAGYDQLRVLQEALSIFPSGVEKVRLRSDTAGYQHELLRYCAKGGNERFGKIELAIGCDVTPEFKKAVMGVEDSDWQAIYKEFVGIG